MKLQLVLPCAFFVAVVLYLPSNHYAQRPPAGGPMPEMQRDEEVGKRSGRSEPSQRRFAFHRDGGTTNPFSALRQFMQSELKNVPLLETRLKALLDIQQERATVQRERWQIAEKREMPADQSLKAFHALVKREDAIAERMSGVVKQLVADAPEIQKQIVQRKTQITARLEELEASGPTLDDEAGEQERDRLSRALKMYDFLEKRIAGAAENPDRTDLLNRFFKGFPGAEEREPENVQQIRQRIEELSQEQRELQRRILKLDKELDNLRDMIHIGGRKAFRRAGNDAGDGPPEGPLQGPPDGPPPPPPGGAGTAMPPPVNPR